jgi:hypothetical protein
MDDRLDATLQRIAADVAFPPTPDLRGAVAERLAAPDRRRWWSWPVPRALVLAVLVTIVLAASVAAAVLVLPGLRLTLVPTLPSPDVPDEPLATRLALGEPIAVDALTVAVPAELGVPDEAYVLGDGEVVTLVYAAGDRLPELGATRIGLLIQVIDGALDREMVEKLAVEVGASVTPVTVDGAEGYWISGPPHLVRYRTETDASRAQATRLVGDTLAWERDGVLYRIESGLGMAAALRIAESIGDS